MMGASSLLVPGDDSLDFQTESPADAADILRQLTVSHSSNFEDDSPDWSASL